MTFVLLFTRKHLSNDEDRIDISRGRNGRHTSHSKLHLVRPNHQDGEQQYVAAPRGLYQSRKSGGTDAADG